MRYYTKTEEWILIKEDLAYVGISKHAANELGDIVYVDLPMVGDEFSKDEPFGAIESVKAASDLYMPIKGEVALINEKLEESPELINEDPINNYIIAIKNFDLDELKDLEKKEE